MHTLLGQRAANQRCDGALTVAVVEKGQAPPSCPGELWGGSGSQAAQVWPALSLGNAQASRRLYICNTFAIHLQ